MGQCLGQHELRARVAKALKGPSAPYVNEEIEWIA